MNRNFIKTGVRTSSSNCGNLFIRSFFDFYVHAGVSFDSLNTAFILTNCGTNDLLAEKSFC